MKRKALFAILALSTIIACTSLSSAKTISGKDFIEVPILLYHSISEKPAKDPGILPASSFEKEMKIINDNNYSTYFASEIPKMLEGKERIGKKPITLTFDDGYESFYTIAFPLLKKHGLKSTIFIIKNRIGKKGYLTMRELREISQSGIVEIGAHTISHKNLGKIGINEARVEITESKKSLEKDLNITVKTFAYPYGSFNKAVEKEVKKAGFTAAFAILQPTVKHPVKELYRLHRINAGKFKQEMQKFLETGKIKFLRKHFAKSQKTRTA